MRLEVRFRCSCLVSPQAIWKRIIIILVVLLVTWELGGLPAVHALYGSL